MRWISCSSFRMLRRDGRCEQVSRNRMRNQTKAKRIKVIPHCLLLFFQNKFCSADITQVRKFSAFALYIQQLECDKLKEKLGWDEIRILILSIKSDEKIQNGKECRKCVWSNTESGQILCSRYKCVRSKKWKNTDKPSMYISEKLLANGTLTQQQFKQLDSKNKQECFDKFCTALSV